MTLGLVVEYSSFPFMFNDFSKENIAFGPSKLFDEVLRHGNCISVVASDFAGLKLNGFSHGYHRYRLMKNTYKNTTTSVTRNIGKAYKSLVSLVT